MTCPKCGSRYLAVTVKVLGKWYFVKCKECRHSWHVDGYGEAVEGGAK